MTSPLERHPTLQARVRTAQIVVGGLIFGVLLFAGILLVMRATGVEPPISEPGPLPLSWILGFVAVMQVPVFFILRTAILGQARRRIADGTWRAGPAGDASLEETGDAGRLFQAWFQGTIVLCAGLEAGALLCLVAFLIEGNPWMLVLGGVFGLALAMQMPSRADIDQLLETELERLEAQRTS